MIDGVLDRVGKMPWAWLAVRPSARFGDTLQRVRCALRLVILTQWETFVHWWRVDSRRARRVAYTLQTRMWADAQIARTLLLVAEREKATNESRQRKSQLQMMRNQRFQDAVETRARGKEFIIQARMRQFQ